MKRINHAILILMVSICFSYCHNDYIPVPGPPPGIGFEGIIHYPDWNMELLSESEGEYNLISLSGSGYSNVLELGYLSIENSHVSIYNESEDLIYIKKGKFRIRGAGKIAIYGTYEGIGTYKNDIFSSELDFTILGGQVFFEGASGNFNGNLESSLDNPKRLNMYFNGHIIGI